MKVPVAKKLPSGSWRCQVMVDGRRVSVTGQTEKETIAEAMQIKARLTKEKKQETGGSITLEEGITRYIEEHSNVLSPSTVEGYQEIKR